MFCPTEVIFCVTSRCNLRCKHCFTNKDRGDIDVAVAKDFLTRLLSSSTFPKIEYVGFSGGEPFLFVDAICALSELAFRLDCQFDGISTNGVWWSSLQELQDALHKLYDARYDGYIRISIDAYHMEASGLGDAYVKKILTFTKEASAILGNTITFEIQSVVQDCSAAGQKVATKCTTKQCGATIDKLISSIQKSVGKLHVYNSPIAFPADDARSWQAPAWFKDADCFSMGNILFVLADGDIVPCCGFNNENPALKIGNIKNDIAAIAKNAAENHLVSLCFGEGLSSVVNKFDKIGRKTSDPCVFCEFYANECLTKEKDMV